MEIRTIVEFNPQSYQDTINAMNKEKELGQEVWLLPTSSLISTECLHALTVCHYECFKTIDYNTVMFYKAKKK